MFCWLKVGDRDHGLGKERMLVLVCFDSALLDVEKLGLYEYFFPDYLIYLFGGRLRLGTWLVLIAIFNC